MTASPRTYPRLRVEATDPATPGERLAKLAYHRVAEINALARANPGLPDGTLLHFLGSGDHAAWTNPSAMFRLLEGATPEMQNGARALVFRGNAPDMAATVTRDWWANETDPAPMLGHLAFQASWHQQTPVHRRAIRALCACLRWAAANRALSTEGRFDFIKSSERLHPVVGWFEDWAIERPHRQIFPLNPLTMEVSGFRRAEEGGAIASSEATRDVNLFCGALERAVVPLSDATGARPTIAEKFQIVLDPPLANVLRAAIPDPTEGL